ncbi:cytochrome P450 90B1-like [Iris pallida]|uniref:Cytochrome P450 90B1-like n=1 Tax=Iris pallida TaxID=29817 RepID=A0AAX6HVV7_IRIPA|nr:cytochrome P450 90B1-like [Iris pallida]
MEDVGAGVVLVNSVAVVLIAIVCLIVIARRRGSHSKLPPGWSGWPLLGETLSFLKPSPATSMGNFMELRMSRFGKIFSSNLLGAQAIVSADPELNRFVLQNEMKLFESYWPQHIWKLFGDRNNLGIQTGVDAHKRFRSIVVGAFVTTSRLQTSFLGDADEAAGRLISSWKDGSVVSVVDAAKKFLFDVMVKNALGMETGDAETEKLRSEFKKFCCGITTIPINFPGSPYSISLKAKENIRRIIFSVLGEHMRAGENAERGRSDFIEWLVKNSSLSQEQICELIQGIVFASEDTTSRAIPLAIYFLSICPKAIQQLREEHLHVVGSETEDGPSKLTWDGYKQMVFTQCVINETLRLGNITKLLIKKATTNVEFKGYEIPRGCRVFTYISAGHMDPSLFEDPPVFNPWRWLSNAGIVKTDKNFMAFGGGPRHCPGAELARLQMAAFLRHLVLNYDWWLAEDDEPVAAPLAQFPKGLPISIRSLTSSKH